MLNPMLRQARERRNFCLHVDSNQGVWLIYVGWQTHLTKKSFFAFHIRFRVRWKKQSQYCDYLHITSLHAKRAKRKYPTIVTMYYKRFRVRHKRYDYQGSRID
jgi:hypothetical protein